MGFMQASPWTVNPSFHFWQQRVSHVVAQLSLETQSGGDRRAVWGRLVSLPSPLSGFVVFYRKRAEFASGRTCFALPSPGAKDPSVFPQGLG